MPHTIHLRPHAPVAERVLLPGDPGRALRLAQLLTDQPRMLNHNRGLWGYTGTAPDGEPLTVQSSGMGGPSAAIVVEELIALGARRIVRVGTCGALDGDLALGDLLAPETVLAGDGTSRALGGGERVAPDAGLARALHVHARAGTVATVDLFYGEDLERWARAGAHAVEMEAAAVLTVAARAGIAAAAVLAVSDLVGGERRERIGDDALQAAEEALGRAGLAALSAYAAPGA